MRILFLIALLLLGLLGGSGAIRHSPLSKKARVLSQISPRQEQNPSSLPANQEESEDAPSKFNEELSVNSGTSLVDTQVSWGKGKRRRRRRRAARRRRRAARRRRRAARRRRKISKSSSSRRKRIAARPALKVVKVVKTASPAKKLPALKLPAGYTKKVICEDTSATLSAKYNHHFEIKYANYGRRDTKECKDFKPSTFIELSNVDKRVANDQCVNDVRTKVRNECGTRRTCKLFASTGIYGDKCAGTDKYLEIWYKEVENTTPNLKPFPPDPLDIAKGKEVLASGFEKPHVPKRVVDGNCLGLMHENTCFLSKKESLPWLRVDLGYVTAIEIVNIWDRIDSTASDAERKLEVAVSEAVLKNPDLRKTSKYWCDKGAWKTENTGKFHTDPQDATNKLVALCNDMKAQYITVFLPEGGQFGICEVEVLEPKCMPVKACAKGDCKKNNGGCDVNTICIEHATGREHRCGPCPPGYTGNGLIGCKDIDECTLKPNGGCDALTKCVNKPGFHECTPCPKGYKGNGLVKCVDIDECEEGSGGCSLDPQRQCTNLVPGFKCEDCPTGYENDGLFKCNDIDECATRNGGCPAMVKCKNTIGSFKCAGCPHGYNFKRSDSGKEDCVDNNECLKNNGGCDPRVQCMNKPGGRDCGDCPAGSHGNGHNGCVDNNECEHDHGGCDLRAQCINTPGSFMCGPCPFRFHGKGNVRGGCKEIIQQKASPTRDSVAQKAAQTTVDLTHLRLDQTKAKHEYELKTAMRDREREAKIASLDHRVAELKWKERAQKERRDKSEAKRIIVDTAMTRKQADQEVRNLYRTAAQGMKFKPDPPPAITVGCDGCPMTAEDMAIERANDKKAAEAEAANELKKLKTTAAAGGSAAAEASRKLERRQLENAKTAVDQIDTKANQAVADIDMKGDAPTTL